MPNQINVNNLEKDSNIKPKSKFKLAAGAAASHFKNRLRAGGESKENIGKSIINFVVAPFSAVHGAFDVIVPRHNKFERLNSDESSFEVVPDAINIDSSMITPFVDEPNHDDTTVLLSLNDDKKLNLTNGEFVISDPAQSNQSLYASALNIVGCQHQLSESSEAATTNKKRVQIEITETCNHSTEVGATTSSNVVENITPVNSTEGVPTSGSDWQTVYTQSQTNTEEYTIDSPIKPPSLVDTDFPVAEIVSNTGSASSSSDKLQQTQNSMLQYYHLQRENNKTDNNGFQQHHTMAAKSVMSAILNNKP